MSNILDIIDINVRIRACPICFVLLVWSV